MILCCSTTFLLAAAALAQPLAPKSSSRPDTQVTQLTFTDVTVEAGLDAWHAQPSDPAPRAAHMLAGGAVGDFNNDGWQDFFFLAGGALPDKLFINNADGTFTDRALEWDVNAKHIGAGAIAADFNDDGYLDIYVTSHGAPGTLGETGKHRLYLNNGPDNQGQFTFTDVAQIAGVETTATIIADGFSAAAGDYDLDGDLDLAVAGWFQPIAGNTLFRNDGVDPQGVPTFTNVTHILPADMLDTRGFAPSFVDTDGDWYPELLWVSDFSTSKYFVNNTDGTFSEQTVQAGVGLDQWGMGNTQGDFDADGRLDWYVTSIYDPEDLTDYNGNKLYMNLGDHTFIERAAQTNTDDGGWGWGVVAVDLDHDADLDLAQTNGWHNGDIFINDASKIFLNDGSGSFQESAQLCQFDHTSQGRGLARIDYDNDGDQDIIIMAREGRLSLFRNNTTGPNANWVRVLIDTSARKDLAPHGIGARVRAITDSDNQLRYVDVAGHYLCNSEHTVHFGLARAQTVTIDLQWHDGTFIRLPEIPVNQTVIVRTPARPE